MLDIDAGERDEKNVTEKQKRLNRLQKDQTHRVQQDGLGIMTLLLLSTW
jgi:hypothetical protein